MYTKVQWYFCGLFMLLKNWIVRMQIDSFNSEKVYIASKIPECQIASLFSWKKLMPYLAIHRFQDELQPLWIHLVFIVIVQCAK